MKKIFYIILFICMISTSLFAESVFLKDGSIVEGTIKVENNVLITLAANDGTQKQIPRKTVLRILYNENYKQKQFFYKQDKTYVQGYLVEETSTTYTYRVNLESKEEFMLKKNEIVSISKFMIPSLTKRQYFYLNDGRIIEGRVESEENSVVKIEVYSGGTAEILQSNIMHRSQYDGKSESHLVSKNGDRIETYIVDEDAENYICRNTISNTSEHSVKKADVRILSAEEIASYHKKNLGYLFKFVIPGWPQFSTSHYVEGSFFLTAFLGSGSYAVYSIMKYRKDKNKYGSLNSSNSDAEFKKARNNYTKSAKNAKISLGIVGGVYALNLLDMLRTRPEYPSFDKLYQASSVNAVPDVKIGCSDFSGKSCVNVSLGMTVKF